jgi:aerobic-type carbon monoxide dehydrogenase small subunit (CoxS/CutS family)
MKAIATILACATFCSCSVFKDNYKYTTMHKLHTTQHVVFDRQYADCGYCNKDKAEAVKSMIADKEIDFTKPIL